MEYSGIEITTLIIEFALAVIGVLLYLLFKQMRELTQTVKAADGTDLSGLEQGVKDLQTQGMSRQEDSDLRQTHIDIATALSVQDRLQLARLVALMNIVDDKVTSAATHAEGVAEDLLAAHERANEVEGPSGAAADAASRTA